MIVSFSVSNFRSFQSEQTLSLVAGKRASGGHEDHAVKIPDSDEKVLKAAVLYGANGAGKSNLFKAIGFLHDLALTPKKRGMGTGRTPFKFSQANQAPSEFDLQFIAGDKLYRFGVIIDDDKIIEEWLVQVIGTKEKILYERVTDSRGKVTVELGEELSSENKKLKALATVGGPQNQSFLATIQANLDSFEIGESLKPIFEWFIRSLDLIEPDSRTLPIGHMLTTDEEFKKFANDFLKSSSTGVDRLIVRKEELSEEQLYKLVPKNLINEVISELEKEDSKQTLIGLPGRGEVLIEKAEPDHFYSISIQAEHNKDSENPVVLDINEESDGTQRLLQLMPALHRLRTMSAVFVIDEIDRSMHPLLVWKFIEFFLSSCKQENRQIIVTTHESNLLDLTLLRRDEIWFVEKDSKGATQMYSLVDYRVRKDLEIRKHYLQGRFGAIPFLGNIERLTTQEH